MDDLTYQLELSDSFDSGNGTDDDEEGDPTAGETEVDELEARGRQAAIVGGAGCAEFSPCGHCRAVATEDLHHCLRRCGRLLVTSVASFRRLRRICCRLRGRHARAREAAAERARAAGRAEEAASHWQAEAAAGAGAANALRAALDGAREELAKRTHEVQRYPMASSEAVVTEEYHTTGLP